MVRNQWALAVTGLGSCLIIAAACAGGDTPPRDAALEEKIRSTFDPDYPPVGAAGGVSMTGVGGGSGTGGGGTGGGSAAGAGGGASGGASGSGAAGSGSSGSGSTVAACDWGKVIEFRCGGVLGSGCHGDNSNFGNFGSTEAAAKALIDKPVKIDTACGKYIDSANPDQSAIIRKLGDPTCGGAQMPFNSDPLEQEDIDCIRGWIESVI